MRPIGRDVITVRWIDADTGKDFTDRMNDPLLPPGDGVLELARALGRAIAARQSQAEHQLLKDVAVELQIGAENHVVSRTAQPGDELVLNGVRYRYDGPSLDGEHFTRLRGENWEEALVSLRRGSDAADWMLRHLTREP